MYLLGEYLPLAKWELNPERPGFVDSPSANVCHEMRSLILIELFLPLLCDGTALSCLTRARLEVAKSA